jgi:hypothetical protein
MAKEPEERFADVDASLKALEVVPRPLLLPGDDAQLDTADVSLGSVETVVRSPAVAAAIAGRASPLLRMQNMVARGVRRLLMASAAVVSILSLVVIAIAAFAIYVLSNEDGSAVPALEDMLPDVMQSKDVVPKDLVAEDEASEGEAPVAEFQQAPPTVPEPLDTPSVAAALRPKARDPFRHKVPKPLSAIRARLLKDYPGNEKMIATLRRYNRDYPEDSRGHLLLAQLYMNRKWYKDVVTQYEFAFRRDPSSRGDRHMLRDLVILAGQAGTADEAARLLGEAYGQEANRALRSAIKQSTEDDVKQRLERLQQSMVPEARP